jgi:basic amino acid/polyamine antiporter, APA family
MVGVALGSGIFRTPHTISQELSSPSVILLMWGLGGLLALFGALTYAELAAAYPRSGGLYHWLYQGFGARVAFIFGWTYMLITKPAAAAAIPFVFAEYLAPLVKTYAGVSLEPWDLKFIVIAVLVGLTGLNTLGMKLGAGVSVILTAVKVLSVAAIVALALALGHHAASSGVGTIGSLSNFHAEPAAIKPFWMAIVPVMSAILWTYDGWSDVGAVAGEVRNPQRTLPRVYLAGTLGLVGIYLSVNAAYIYILPLADMRANTVVAGEVLQRLIGPIGATVISLMVVVSTFGSTHASILTGARVTFAQAQDGLLFRVLGRISPRFQTPALALWSQCALSITALLMFDNFEKLAGVFVFTMWIFYGMGAAAVFVLRRTQPQVERPYRCWGYPVVPALFLLAACGMTALTILDAANTPGGVRNIAICLGVLAVGVPMYDVWRRVTGIRPGE